MLSDATVTIYEIQSGSRGTEYIWVLEKNKIVPIRKFGKIKIRMDTSRRRIVEIKIPLEKLIGKTIYIFSFSRKGYLYISKKIIKSSRDIKNLYENGEKANYKETAQLLLNYYGGKLEYLDKINRYAEKIQELIKELGYKSIILERGTRIKDAIEDFDRFICSLLSNPSIQGVFTALKNIYTTLYELFVLLTIVQLLRKKYKLLYDSSFSNILEIHTTRGKPYFIFETIKSYIIVTYQFQPIPQEYVTGASLVRSNIITEQFAEELTNEKWREVLQILDKYGGHIRPDILIFEIKKSGIKPEEIFDTLRSLLHIILLANNEEERKKALTLLNYVVNKVILIDCKVNLGVKDLEQLEYYKRLFNEVFYSEITEFCIVSPTKDYIINNIPLGWEILEENEIESIIKTL